MRFCARSSTLPIGVNKLKTTTPEKEIQKQCLQWLKIKRVRVWRNNTGSVQKEYKGKKRFIRFGEPGISDILGIAPDGSGRFMAIETKAATGKLSEDQQAFLDNVTQEGGIAIVVRSLDDLIKAFKAHFGEEYG